MSLFFSRFGAVVVLCVALSGQTPQPQQQERKDSKESAPGAPVPPPPPPSDPAAGRVGATAAVDPKSYIIDPEDVVSVRVWREPEMSGLFTVRPDGKITMPLVGDIQAGGVTPDQLQQKVVEALQTLMNRPQVVASVHEVRSKRYYVSGEVNRPGQYPLIGKVTIVEALTMAGGFREFADMKGVKVMRGSERIKFNYKNFIKGKELDKNLELKPGDHIVVP
jgi:polysaccharide biosynthesis/export protein